MTSERRFIRGALVIGALFAISVPIVALGEAGGRSPAAWAAIAASLAVLASIASAWSSQHVIELQENALLPHLRAYLDFRSRYGLAQFRVANRGGSAAFDVRLDWDNDKPLKTEHGVAVEIFGAGGTLPVLLPGDEASILLGASQAFLAAHPQATWSGTLRYRDTADESRIQAFTMTAEHERVSLVHDAEGPKTQVELQKIPKALGKIEAELGRIRRLLQVQVPPAANPDVPEDQS